MRRLSFIALSLLIGPVAPQPAVAQAASQAASDPADDSRSLFELTDREILIGGRASSIDGDPARFQRYQDVRDGLLVSGFRWSFAPPDGVNSVRARANNIGWRDQEYFADGITEDLITSLSRFPTLFVVARNTTFTFKGQPTNVRRVAGDLGVRYIVEGGVRRTEEMLGVGVRLYDGDSGAECDTDFPAQNLPLCVFRPRGAGGAFHIGAGIGDFILDLASCVQEKLLAALDADIRAACEADRLNAFFKPRLGQVSGAERGLAQTSEEILLCSAQKAKQDPKAILR